MPGSFRHLFLGRGDGFSVLADGGELPVVGGWLLSPTGADVPVSEGDDSVTGVGAGG
jgi:hypothetical protein